MATNGFNRAGDYVGVGGPGTDDEDTPLSKAKEIARRIKGAFSSGTEEAPAPKRKPAAADSTPAAPPAAGKKRDVIKSPFGVPMPGSPSGYEPGGPELMKKGGKVKAGKNFRGYGKAKKV